MDELIARYAQALQSIYDRQTAGDCTFIGVLSEFARDVERELSKPHEPVAEQLTREEMRGLWE